MESNAPLHFGRFRLDRNTQCLWRGRKPVALAPKEFAALCFLAERAGRLVTKDELRQAVWEDSLTSDASIRVCIAEIRKALGDMAQKPKIIATVHRRGYRLVAPVFPGADIPASVAPQAKLPARFLPTWFDPLRAAPHLVGRERELVRLDQCLRQALCGNRQVVFVTGESGIGKSTLIEALLVSANRDKNIWTAGGQCLGGEPYQPMLEALGQLALESGRHRWVSVLKRHAPTWLMQLPGICSRSNGNTELARSRTAMLAPSSGRMRLEMNEALAVLTSETPLLLVLEDLHACDIATLGLIEALARDRRYAKLMILGAYRSAEATEHPLSSLTQELRSQGLCWEVALNRLPVESVEEFLAAAFPDHNFPQEFLSMIHRDTEGNPLRINSLLRDLQQRQLIFQCNGRWTSAQVPASSQLSRSASRSPRQPNVPLRPMGVCWRSWRSRG